MKPISAKFNAQQWCNLAKFDEGKHSLLITDVAAHDFYGGQCPNDLGGHELNTFSVGYHTDDSLPSYTDPLFLQCFENALLDYTYHTVFFDLPDRRGEPENYRLGIEKMLDLLAAYQPQAHLIWVDSTMESPVGRELCEARDGFYADMIGKRREDLETLAAEIAKLPLANRAVGERALAPATLSAYREAMYWCIYDMDDYTEDDSRRRILLIGDSICFGYYRPTRKLLHDDYIVDTYAMSFAPADPAVFRNLLPVLRAHHYDAIHINLGMHQCEIDTAEGGYESAIRSVLVSIRAECPDTAICFATTTTIMKSDDLTQFSDETFGWVTDRNNAAKRVCAEFSLPMDDLFTLCYEQKPEKADTHHFKDSTLLAEQVADSVRSLFA